MALCPVRLARERLVAEDREVKWLTFVAARPDGDMLSVSSSEGWLGVWLPMDNRVVATHALGGFINRIGWTRDGAHLLATVNADLHVFSADGTTRVTTIETGHRSTLTFAVHPSQPIVATSGSDGRVRLWELPSGTLQREVLESRAGKMGTGTALALTDEAIMVGYENGYYATCDPDGGNPGGGQVFGGGVASFAAVRPRGEAGQTFLAGGSRGKLAELLITPEKMLCVETWSDPPKPIAANTIEFDEKGRFVVACSDDTAMLFKNTLDRFGTRFGNAFWSDRKAWKQDYIVSAACFVPKTNVIATSHFTGCVKLWRDDKSWGESAIVRFENDEPKWDEPKSWPTLE